ncbi:type VI secretion system tip protein TssI/VgrG [Paracoccaceae bacterium Fryx2]|nr:type VI secretion system tip protein TssI/VgrG [Paracoccaceae bacterium Fryx2]
MPIEAGPFENRSIRMSGSYGPTDLRLKCAVVEEGMNRVVATTLEFLSKDKALDLKTVVGAQMDIEVDAADDQKRWFRGMCISAQTLGTYQGYGHYTAEVRSWNWFLTRSRECRVFQDKSTVDIIQSVLGDHGFSALLQKKLSETYPPRAFCLQYRETDLDFLTRLMEEEGIYCYFIHSGSREKLVLADAIAAHEPVPGAAQIEYFEPDTDYRRTKDHIFQWVASENATTGRVTLTDYDFERPKLDLKMSKSMPKGTHGETGHEHYDHPGHYRDADPGERYTRVRIEAEAIRHKLWQGVGNVRMMGIGQTFQLTGHPRTGDEGQYLITRATHQIQVETLAEDMADRQVVGRRLEFAPDNTDTYRCIFDAVPKSEPYRAPHITPWPEIPGVQTALVVGTAGEEIDTDEYGRVRIQFHWDRLGKKNETSSVWVRTMMPWTGKGWGMIHIPRIGQEVVVQFEEGNPDRPLIIGMMYNADTMPPYALPDNKTQSGIKTNSSKGGNGFNELMMEDKKGEELVRFQAEKDYTQIVKNNATITVGLEKKDAGDMTLTVHHDLTETVKTGDHTFKIETGSQIIDIKTDKTETITGKSDLTVTGNVTETVKTGNVTATVEMGNEARTLKLGNYTLDTSLGKIALTAMQEISLTVGANSVVIDQSGVKITGIMVTVEGKAMLEAKAPMTQVKGDALLILKGGLTMIN